MTGMSAMASVGNSRSRRSVVKIVKDAGIKAEGVCERDRQIHPGASIPAGTIDGKAFWETA